MLTSYSNLSSPDEQLSTDLQTCIEAVSLIEREQDQIRKEIDLETNVTRRDLLWWEHDFIKVYIERAAIVAERRLEYLDSLNTDAKREEELRTCERDVVHWFQYWAWSLDPRVTALPVVPFYPFNFQEDTIRELDQLILVRRTDAVLDKSRDQGASWIAIDLSVHHWRFIPFFQALFGSYKEELVDSLKEPDTLLEKVRFQLRRLPAWMLPRGFKMTEDAGYMKIVNPEQGSLIAGAAPTVNFGRAGRYSVVWFDELAAWRFAGYPQWTAASQSARCKIAISTPKGKANKFSDLRHSGKVKVISLHWKRHPFKDDRWYQGQSLSMDPVEIAQELDIDYEASQPGRIFPMFHEVFHVITWSEFKAVYGVDHIPATWNLARAQDVGTSDGHPNVTAWVARPRKNDKWNDTLFFYREFVAPTHWSSGQIAEGDWDPKTKQLIEPGIWQREKPLKENDRMSFSLLSWEAKSEKRTYSQDCKRYPLHFTNIEKPNPNGGIAEMRNLMTLLSEPNPFVRDPRTGEHLFGRTRFIILVDDAQGELMVDPADGENLMRAGAIDEKGHVRARFELPLYHYPVSEKDKPVAKRAPFKRDDDWIDDARYICRKWGPPAAEQTTRERIEEALPDSLKTENLPQPAEIEAMTTGQREELMAVLMARDREVKKAEKKLESKGKAQHWRRKRGGQNKRPRRG